MCIRDRYILDQIQGIGANLVYASYSGAGHRITAVALDELTVDDVAAVSYTHLDVYKRQSCA